ncbi:MAG: hypothetical protein H6812_07140 [Phycisphaeraceae bacterium]|nr:hypothetical protein [Phycisphaeraceae bacterium]
MSTTGLFAAAMSDGQLAGLMAGAGIAVITATLLLQRIRKRGKTRVKDDSLPRDAREKLKRIADRATVHERLEKAMVEAQEATRACAAQIGTRTAKLEALLDQADQRMQRMEQLAARLEALMERAYSEPRMQGAGSPPVAVREAGTVTPSARREPAGAAKGGSGFFERSAGVIPASATSDPLSRRVYGLADEGLAPPEIAKRLDEQIGKVELILALRG